MMSSSTKAQSKQLLGVHAALRSKKTLDTADIVRDVRLEMLEMSDYQTVSCRRDDLL